MKLPGEWDCPVEEQYEPPAGYYDQFYIYPFDAAQAPSGSIGIAVEGLQVALDGDADFVLRRIAGAGTLNVAGVGLDQRGFQVYDAVKRRFFSSAIDPTLNFNLDLAIAPEKVYPRAGQIWFDLATFSPALRLSGTTPLASIPTGQDAFQGVKRFQGQPERPTYKYREKPFVYVTRFTLDWNAYLWSGASPVSPATPRQFTVVVDDYDFELLGMNLIDVSTGAYPTTLDPPFAMTLYNKSQIALSSRPVNSTYLFANSADPAAGTYYSRLSPGVVYPVGSQIKFDIHSLLLSADLLPTAPVYEIGFLGVRRIPV